jgi:putative ABC transport system ATP-binding protein
MKNDEIVKISGLVKRFPIGGGFFTALNGIDLSFRTGEFAGLVGPSGSGKTTLLNIIGSLDGPTEGSAVVLGQSVRELSQKKAARLRKESLGFIFQTYNLLPVYTVFENVEFPLLLLEMSAGESRRSSMPLNGWDFPIRSNRVLPSSQVVNASVWRSHAPWLKNQCLSLQTNPQLTWMQPTPITSCRPWKN